MVHGFLKGLISTLAKALWGLKTSFHPLSTLWMGQDVLQVRLSWNSPLDSPSTRSAFIQLTLPFHTELGLVMEWGEVEVREGEADGLLMSEKAFITCLTFG